MVERFRKMCKEAIEDDPLQPVAIIYEENLSKIKRDLGTAGVEPTEFEALVPNFLAMAPSLYRWFITGKPETYFYFLSISWRSHIIPPTPDTQAELDLDTRYIFFSSCKHIHTHIRFTRDSDGRPIILGDYKFEDEPNGRVVLFGR